MALSVGIWGNPSISLAAAPPKVSGGSVVLMGLEPEDGHLEGGRRAHGPISAYVNIVKKMKVTNGGNGILVIGGSGNDNNAIKVFWKEIASKTNMKATFVSGNNISSQSFDGFAIIAIASDIYNTPNGGLTNEENDLLAARGGDIANFINKGGGLFGGTSDFDNPYGYMTRFGIFTFNLYTNKPIINKVSITTEGAAFDMKADELSVPAWHDEFTAFPNFFKVLVRNETPLQQFSQKNPLAIGGNSVIISPQFGFKKVTGGGYVENDKNKQSFGFNMLPDEQGLRVQLEYNDHLKSNKTDVVKIKIDNYAMSLKQKLAEIKENGKTIGIEFDTVGEVTSSTSGKQNSTIHIRVVDRGEPGTKDEFRLTILDGPNKGYTSQSGIIQGGNIQVHQ